jgi:hypothetical protein
MVKLNVMNVVIICVVEDGWSNNVVVPAPPPSLTTDFDASVTEKQGDMTTKDSLIHVNNNYYSICNYINLYSPSIDEVPDKVISPHR